MTFCPYAETEFWVGSLGALHTATPNPLTGFNLQHCAGSGGTRPAASRSPATPDAAPALLEGQDAAQIEATLAEWRSTSITGGWIWLRDDVIFCKSSLASYVKAIPAGLS